jgi:putative transcriptional regulator
MAAKTKKTKAKTGKKTKARTSRLTEELLETARDMHASGLLTRAAHDKITMRHLGAAHAVTVTLTGRQIKALREKCHVSQAVFANYLNLTADYVSKLERGAKRPTGPALVLLDVIRRKGIEAIL